MCVLRVLPAQSLSDAALKDIYRSVVLAKLLCASPACWRFTTASDKHRTEAFVCRGIRLQSYDAEDLAPTQLAVDTDDFLFSKITQNRHRLLYQFLPDPICRQYNLFSQRQMIKTL